jgi:hypothetical protein
MNLIESMLADISKLKNLDQLLKEKEEQKRIVRCLMQMERISVTEPQQNQQPSLFNWFSATSIPQSTKFIIKDPDERIDRLTPAERSDR